MVDALQGTGGNIPTVQHIKTTDLITRASGQQAPGITRDLQRPTHVQGPEKDSVDFHLHLGEDLDKLQQSVSLLHDKIREQMERLTNFTDLKPEEARQFLPPTDASAQDLLNFYNPQNSANRIVRFTTGFFSAYQNNHSDQTDDENIKGFVNLIQNAIDKGFVEAEKILGGFEKSGEIGKNIEKTYELVMKESRNSVLKFSSVPPSGFWTPKFRKSRTRLPLRRFRKPVCKPFQKPAFWRSCSCTKVR
jgi:hypothetical protein